MLYSAWLLLGAGSMVTGASLGMLLSCRPSLEPPVGLAGLIGLITCGIGVVRVVEAYRRVDVTFFVVLMAMGCLIGGYGLASALMSFVRPGRRETPVLREAEHDAPADPGISVILLADAEPELYRPSLVTLELRDLAAQGLPEATVTVTPFLYAAQKARYRAVGGRSPAMRQLRAIAELLRLRLDVKAFPSIEVASSYEPDALARVVAALSRRGARRIIVVTHAIAESYAEDEAKNIVSAMRPQQHGIAVTYTPPLWGSERLAELMTRRILACMIDARVTGAALVMHGQTEARERSHPDFDAQESAFANRVRLLLMEEGLPEANVRLCWADWRTPDITETVRHLAALGCSRILICPLCFPLESIATVLDMPIAVRQARVEPDVYVSSLAAWGEDPDVIEEIEARVLAAAREMDVS